MYQAKPFLDGDVIVLPVERLHGFAVLGTLPTPLEGLVGDHTGVDFAPVRQEPGRDFLAGVTLDPFVDITLVAPYGTDEVSIMACTLDGEKGRATFDRLIETTGFRTRRPSGEVIASLLQSSTNWVHAYHLVKQIPLPVGVNVNTVFNVSAYAGFLMRYHDCSEQDAMSIAGQQLGFNGFAKLQWE